MEALFKLSNIISSRSFMWERGTIFQKSRPRNVIEFLVRQMRDSLWIKSLS